MLCGIIRTFPFMKIFSQQNSHSPYSKEHNSVLHEQRKKQRERRKKKRLPKVHRMLFVSRTSSYKLLYMRCLEFGNWDICIERAELLHSRIVSSLLNFRILFWIWNGFLNVSVLYTCFPFV